MTTLHPARTVALSRGEIALATLASLAALLIARGDAFGLTFFWDELGYYVPFAYTYFESGFRFHGGWMPPVSYKMPLLAIEAAALTRVFGWGIPVFRVLVFLHGAFFLSGAYALSRRYAGRGLSALATLALLCSPVVLSEAGIYQPDIPMAAFGVWALILALDGRWKSSAALFTAGVLTHGIMLGLAPVYMGILALSGTFRDSRARRRSLLLFAAPAVALLAAWNLHTAPFQKAASPEVVGALVYNSIFLQGPMALLKRFAHRFVQIFFVDGRAFVTLAFAFPAVLAWKRGRLSARALSEPAWLLVFVAWVTLFLTFFGVTAQRYFIVALPALFALGVYGMEVMRVRGRKLGAGLFLLVALAGQILWRSPPNKYASFHARSAYRDEVRVMMKSASRLRAQFADSLIVTSWPLSEALSRPFLMYVDRPLPVIDLQAPLSKQAPKLAEFPGPRVLALLEGDSTDRTALLPEMEKVLGLRVPEDCFSDREGEIRVRICPWEYKHR